MLRGHSTGSHALLALLLAMQLLGSPLLILAAAVWHAVSRKRVVACDEMLALLLTAQLLNLPLFVLAAVVRLLYLKNTR